MRVISLLLVLLMVAPTGIAEFGHETGIPIGVDGPVYPFIPADLAERHPEETAAALAAGEFVLDPEIAEADPLNKVGGYTLYPYYGVLTAELRRLAEEFPGKMRLSTAGQSHLGLDLWLVEIADFDNPDRVPLSEREVIYLDGGTHSNEYSGVYFTTEWLQFLLEEFETNETARWIVENRHTFIMPMINPDGSHAFGRVNAIDVNINRNFPGTWGTVDETPVLNWPGPYPASEPETQAVIQVMSETRPDFVQSTHCCGNLWLHPYGAAQLGHAPDYDMYTNICGHVFPDLTIDVQRKKCGEIWSTIYPASGTTADEGYALVGASSWTYEMSGRANKAGPWGEPITEFDVREQEIESWRGVMHGFLHAEMYGALPVLTDVAGTADGLTVTVQNQGWGNITQATLSFGSHSVSIPALTPGQKFILEIEGDFTEESVPVDIEWKKRMHPDSNWGRKLFAVDLVADASGDLAGLIPSLPPAPSMGDLLPATPESVLANVTGAPDIVRSIQALNAADDRGAPGLPILALLGAVAAALLVRRR